MAGGLPPPQEHVVAAVAGLGPSLRKLLESRPHGRLPLGVDPSALLGRVERGATSRAADRLPAGALDGIAELYGLTAFERHTLLAAVAAQIEPAVAALFAALHEDPADEALTAGLRSSSPRSRHGTPTPAPPSAPLARWLPAVCSR